MTVTYMTRAQRIALFNHAMRPVTCAYAYVILAGGVVEGLLLQTIVQALARKGDSSGIDRYLSTKDDKGWYARKRTEWHADFGITPRQTDRAMNNLRLAKLLEIKVYKLEGVPTPHFRPNEGLIADKLSRILQGRELTAEEQAVAPASTENLVVRDLVGQLAGALGITEPTRKPKTARAR